MIQGRGHSRARDVVSDAFRVESRLVLVVVHAASEALLHHHFAEVGQFFFGFGFAFLVAVPQLTRVARSSFEANFVGVSHLLVVQGC